MFSCIKTDSVLMRREYATSLFLSAVRRPVLDSFETSKQVHQPALNDAVSNFAKCDFNATHLGEIRVLGTDSCMIPENQAQEVGKDSLQTWSYTHCG
ncbi:unnamed protein product, partial [Vitis vinifera]|uniref:Uncharacterized protein n=1 Tax=Vitis vinifera TaxID=29760 RepID=E0CV71_VITVI